MEIDQSILVVGGSGFLGSSFVKKALNYGYSVDIISKNKIAKIIKLFFHTTIMLCESVKSNH